MPFSESMGAIFVQTTPVAKEYTVLYFRIDLGITLIQRLWHLGSVMISFGIHPKDCQNVKWSQSSLVEMNIIFFAFPMTFPSNVICTYP